MYDHVLFKILVRQWLKRKKKYFKSIEKNKYCPYLFFFISYCCLFKIKRNNRISFISNIIEKKKYHIFKKIFRYIINVYIDFLFWLLCLFSKFSFNLNWMKKYILYIYVGNPVSNFLIKLKTKVRVTLTYWVNIFLNC